jgi:hypothetical protein
MKQCEEEIMYKKIIDEHKLIESLALASGFISKEETRAPDIKEGLKVSAALQAYLNEPVIRFRQKIQGEAVSTDFPVTIADSFNVTVQDITFDMGWQEAFKLVPLGKNQDFWEIYDVQNALTFRLMEEGQRVEVSELTGSREIAWVDYYGGALGWTDKLIRYRKVAAMLDIMEIFRNNFWSNKAANHYLILAAAAALNITAYQGAAAIGQARRDILTFNTAIAALANRNLNKGYGNIANAPLLCYANPADEPRIEAVFELKTNSQGNVVGAGVGATQITRTRPVKRIYTYDTSILPGFPIIILPMRKIQRADDMPPTSFRSPKDPLTLSIWEAVWAIYGAVVGDTDQCGTVTLG